MTDTTATVDQKPLRLPKVVLGPLISLPNWVLWCWELNKNGRPTKVPYQPCFPARKAASNDRLTWTTYNEALAAYDAGYGDGIGFVLTGTNFVAFDLDDCIDRKSGAVRPWALALIKAAHSYAEVTPSGTGIRIIGTGSGAELHCKRPVPTDPTISCEIFRRAVRYITMSGEQLGQADTLANLDVLIDQVASELGVKQQQKPDHQHRRQHSGSGPRELSGRGGQQQLSIAARKLVHALDGNERNGMCFCPAHDDQNTPNLHISSSATGKVLWHCFAGCTQRAVLAALVRRRLWPRR
jgi:putative DNA primase/helicase